MTYDYDFHALTISYTNVEEKTSGRKFSRDVFAIESVNSGEKNGGIRRAPRGQVADLVSWVLLGPRVFIGGRSGGSNSLTRDHDQLPPRQLRNLSPLF